MDSLSSILPNNSTPLEYAFDFSAARRLSGIELEGLAGMFSVERCPASVLPWLAQQFGVEEWNSEWSETRKRAFIKATIEVLRYRGTYGAVARPLESLAYDVEIVEHAGTFTFDILVNTEGRTLTQEQYAEIESAALTNKNLRSHLGKISAVVRKSTNRLRVGATLAPDSFADTLGDARAAGLSAAQSFLLQQEAWRMHTLRQLHAGMRGST